MLNILEEENKQYMNGGEKNKNKFFLDFNFHQIQLYEETKA